MSFKEVSFQNQTYIVPTWNEMGKLCFNLAKKVISSEMKFDRIVALAKGGWTWARSFSDYVGIDNLSSLQLEFYTGVYKTIQTPLVIQPLPISVSNESILLFDDVADSGETLIAAKKYLLKSGAKRVTSTTLFIKPWSTLMPEFFGKKTVAWIVFPHEVRETINLLYGDWKKKGMKIEEIEKGLITLGIPKNEVKYFLKNL